MSKVTDGMTAKDSMIRTIHSPARRWSRPGRISPRRSASARKGSQNSTHWPSSRSICALKQRGQQALALGRQTQREQLVAEMPADEDGRLAHLPGQGPPAAHGRSAARHEAGGHPGEHGVDQGGPVPEVDVDRPRDTPACTATSVMETRRSPSRLMHASAASRIRSSVLLGVPRRRRRSGAAPEGAGPDIVIVRLVSAISACPVARSRPPRAGQRPVALRQLNNSYHFVQPGQAAGAVERAPSARSESRDQAGSATDSPTSEGDRMRGLTGKNVIVTGAASGIGRATAARLLEEGAQVLGADITDHADRPAPDERRDAWAFTAVDVTDESSVAPWWPKASACSAASTAS